MNEVVTTPASKLLAVIAVIFVAAALVTLPYQSQVANAAPTKKIQITVTLTDVPANAEDLIVNATISGPNYIDAQETTIVSPSEGDVVKFVFAVPSGSQATVFNVCGNTEDFTLSSCDIPINQPLPTKPGNSPIKVNVDYPYPEPF
jgi:hypothetical protein